jgi:Na+-transporting methylmalonyl-CoA/oxaloacetate decarboxylase beta subunit
MEFSKRALKCIIVISAVLLPVKLFCSLFLFSFLPNVSIKEAASIGIIGGADGPTSVYIAGSVWPATGWLFFLFLSLDIILYAFILVKAIKGLRK